LGYYGEWGELKVVINMAVPYLNPNQIAKPVIRNLLFNRRINDNNLIFIFKYDNLVPIEFYYV
jgi:hypothetical protein